MNRAVGLVVLAACAAPTATHDQMPTAVLDHQDPGRPASHYTRTLPAAQPDDPDGPRAMLTGCMRWTCSTSGGDADVSGVLVVAAIVAAGRRRKRRA